jgi:hypothetical protein
MAGQILCACGAVLVDEVTSMGVRPIGSDILVPFRRTTDHVVCVECLRSYNVRALIERAEDAEVIDLLERLAERGESPPAG